MTEKLLRITASIKSFTPGEYTVDTGRDTYKMFQNISSKIGDSLLSLFNGYDLARFLNTIKASYSGNKIKFNLLKSSDAVVGFYTSFDDSIIERAELHKKIYKPTMNSCEVIKTEILPLKITNSYCKLDIIWSADENYNTEHKIIVYLKKQLPRSNGIVIAIDELLASDSIVKEIFNSYPEFS